MAKKTKSLDSISGKDRSKNQKRISDAHLDAHMVHKDKKYQVDDQKIYESAQKKRKSSKPELFGGKK